MIDNGVSKERITNISISHLEFVLLLVNLALKNKMKMKTINKSSENITTFDEHLDCRYGKIGTIKRTEFEIKAKAFAIGEVIKEERRLCSQK